MITLIRFLLGSMLALSSLFLILLVLIQRGRGGGLAGALGGMGGQSAFGTKAGDVFTRITVGVAAFWIGLCILAINVLGRQQSLFSSDLGSSAPQAVAPATPGAGGSSFPPASEPDLELPAADTSGPVPSATAQPAQPATEAATGARPDSGETPAAETQPGDAAAK